MPAVVIARPDDEIVDLIDRVRSSGDPDVGLVVPASSRALQTPLNVRLLAQFSNAIRPADIDRERGSAPPTARPRQRPAGVRVGAGVRTGYRARRSTCDWPGPGSGRRRRRGGAAAAAVLEPPPAPPPAPPAVRPPLERQWQRHWSRGGCSRSCHPRATTARVGPPPLPLRGRRRGGDHRDPPVHDAQPVREDHYLDRRHSALGEPNHSGKHGSSAPQASLTTCSQPSSPAHPNSSFRQLRQERPRCRRRRPRRP